MQLSSESHARLVRYRFDRLQRQMAQRAVDGMLLASPISLRYACDFSEYLAFQSHIPTAYIWVPVTGSAVLFGSSRRDYLTVGDYQPSAFATPFDGGLSLDGHYAQIREQIRPFMPRSGRIAIERFGPAMAEACRDAGWHVTDAEVIVESAKRIKCDEEIQCIRHSIAVAEGAMVAMRQSTQPGVTEDELLAILNYHNVAAGGYWCDGKMLASGPRTNPWLQESIGRRVRSGDLVAFDTDMIGPMGYLADISRTWVCDAEPTQEQRHAYQHAHSEIQHNMALLRPGVSLYDLSQQAFERDPIYRAQRYVCAFHGCGLTDEYPKIYYAEDWPVLDYPGELEPGMVISVESYSGAVGAKDGVKLEDMALITPQGYERLTRFDYESDLLATAAVS